MGYNARNDEIRDNVTRMRREWKPTRCQGTSSAVAKNSLDQGPPRRKDRATRLCPSGPQYPPSKGSRTGRPRPKPWQTSAVVALLAITDWVEETEKRRKHMHPKFRKLVLATAT